MKYLVVSDTHGSRDRLRRVWQMHTDADGVIFLGDGLSDLWALGEISCPIHAVRGNCDLFSDAFGEPIHEEQWLHVGEYTVLMLHGHKHGVKSGEDMAARYAASRGADLLLFGHTHQMLERYCPVGTWDDVKKPLYLMNPGSLGAPRGGSPSFGLIQTRGRQLLLSFGTL